MQYQTLPLTLTQETLTDCERRHHLKNVLRAGDTQLSPEVQGLKSDKRGNISDGGNDMGNEGGVERGRSRMAILETWVGTIKFSKRITEGTVYLYCFYFLVITMIMIVITILK